MKKKTMLFILISLLIVSISMLLYSHLWGEPIDGLQLSCETRVSADTVTLVCTPKSEEIRLLEPTAKLQGDTLLLRFRKVRRLPWEPSYASITCTFPKYGQRQIWLGGRLIWEQAQ